MEFKLNKVDTELRQKIKDITKPGLIHRKQSLSVSKDKQGKEQNNPSTSKEKKKVGKKKEKLTVDAVKVETVQVKGYQEPYEKNQRTEGIFLDTIK